MSLLSHLTRRPLPEWQTVLIGTALFSAGLFVRGFFLNPPPADVIESPRSTLLPKLSSKEISRLPYPPDALPGARDVDSPFGTFRVYEFGPEDGRKVLLIHGISTPCLSLGAIAHALAEKGCRVMIYDLPGRGYSDTPTDLEHDMRLFTSQILLLLASSPLSWTGSASGGFSIVGYSLGGGIGAAFTSYFPHLVTSLVLIAPSGLIRDHHISRRSRILYSKGVIPEPILHYLVRSRLQKPVQESKKSEHVAVDGEKASTEEAIQAEINIEGNQQVVLSQAHPEITIEAAVNHQLANHQGFVQGFMSSIRYGPIQHQHQNWQRIGNRLSQKNSSDEARVEKVLIILGRTDSIIKLNEIKADAEEVLNGNVEFHILPAGHEVPMAKAAEVADYIWQFWQDN